MVMKVIVLAQKKTDTGVKSTGFKFERYFPCVTTNTLNLDKLKEAKVEINPEDVLVRFGVSAYSLKDSMFKTVLNDARAIKLASNKLNASICFMTRGVNTPRVFTDKKMLKKEDLPVLRRLKFHTKGKDIIMVRSLKDIPDGDYYTKYIPSIAEYRVHVFNGEAIRVSKKFKTGKCKKRKYIHNFVNGYVFKPIRKHDYELERKLMNLSIQATHCLGLNFGAVDILVSKDKVPYVLEVNTAPRLNKFGRQLYTYYIQRLLGFEPDMTKFTRLKQTNDIVLFRDIMHKKKDTDEVG